MSSSFGMIPLTGYVYSQPRYREPVLSSDVSSTPVTVAFSVVFIIFIVSLIILTVVHNLRRSRRGLPLECLCCCCWIPCGLCDDVGSNKRESGVDLDETETVGLTARGGRDGLVPTETGAVVTKLLPLASSSMFHYVKLANTPCTHIVDSSRRLERVV